MSAFAKSPRGQTLVLFALATFLVAGLSLLTISFGARIRERTELQTMADAAAYSNSVQTARTYNAVALINRAEIGHMVAAAGVQSVLAWGTSMMGALNAVNMTLGGTRSPVGFQAKQGCTEPTLQRLRAAFNVKRQQVNKPVGTAAPTCSIANLGANQQFKPKNQFELDDANAVCEMRAMQSATVDLSAQEVRLVKRLAQDLKGQSLTNDLLRKNQTGSPWNDVTAPDFGGTDVNMREAAGGQGDSQLTLRTETLAGSGVTTDDKGDGAGAAIVRGGARTEIVEAATGSRGSAFITRRDDGGILQDQLAQLFNIAEFKVQIQTQGTTYWTKSAGPHQVPRGSWQSQRGALLAPSADRLTADDTDTITVTCGNQKRVLTSLGFLVSSGGGDATASQHILSINVGGQNVPQQHQDPGTAHQLAACNNTTVDGMQDVCPSVWPLYVDFNEKRLVETNSFNRNGRAPTGTFGQPKNIAVLQRDYAQHRSPGDPWLINAHMGFLGGNQTFDNRGLQTVDGMDISKMFALSSGIAYYHRSASDVASPGQTWKEPPNFFNPFWRATLASLAYDLKGPDGNSDVERVLDGVNAKEAAQAFQALLKPDVDYQGF